VVLFFAVSGIWQVYRLHEDRKNGSYKAPHALEVASDFHKAEHMLGNPNAGPFKLAVSIAAGVLVIGTILGLIVALRVTRPVWLAIVLLLLGTALPYLLYLVAT